MSQLCIQYLLIDKFKTDLFAPEKTSAESSSPNSSRILPSIDNEETDWDGTLSLDNYLGLDSFFRDL